MTNIINNLDRGTDIVMAIANFIMPLSMLFIVIGAILMFFYSMYKLINTK